MNSHWREVIERAADTLQDLGAPLNAEELRRLTTAGQQAAGVSDAEARKIAHFIYCYVGACHGMSECFGGADAGTQALWIEAVKIALNTAAGAAPEGWVWVPREPTKAMVNAARRFSVPGYCIAAEQWPAVYRAMLAAAQQPGAQHGQEGRPDV